MDTLAGQINDATECSSDVTTAYFKTLSQPSFIPVQYYVFFSILYAHMNTPLLTGKRVDSDHLFRKRSWTVKFLCTRPHSSHFGDLQAYFCMLIYHGNIDKE